MKEILIDQFGAFKSHEKFYSFCVWGCGGITSVKDHWGIICYYGDFYNNDKSSGWCLAVGKIIT